MSRFTPVPFLTCNSCGKQDLPPEVSLCYYCPTLICSRCRAHHEPVCEDNQKKKRKGLGVTVHPLIQIPYAHPEPSVHTLEPEKIQIYPGAVIGPSDVDCGLAGVADLLKG